MTVGSYAVERDYSHYIAHAAKTVLAVVGTATKGPIGVATVCTSAQDLVNKFGPLATNCYALYAGQYFLSQSSKMYFVRAASDSAKESTVVIKGIDSNGDDVDAFTVSSKEKGTYADGYTVKITKNASDTYNVEFKSKLGSVLESKKDISLDTLSTGYISDYITITGFDDSTASLTPGDYILAGGNDGIEDIEAGHYILAANTLAADTIDMNLFAVPGVSDAAVVNAMLTLAETRGDCLYLVDPPEGLTKEGVIKWHNGTDEYSEHGILNSSYGALYYDWVTIYDSVNKKRVSVPPSVPVAATIAYSDRTADVWYAPAGLTRGLVRGVLDVNTKISKTDIDSYLYTDGNNVNAIYEDPQVGLVLWGQKTLYRENTALNRINVRRLLNYLKRVVVAACNYLTFEPNDRITWNSFELKVIPVLDSIVSRRGIYEYRVVKGETIITDNDIDNYRMPCMIMIRPTKAAEEIPIYFVITSTGADFNEVLESNGITNV